MVCISSAVFEPWRWISNSSYFEMLKRIKTKNKNDNRKWMSVIIIVIIFTLNRNVRIEWFKQEESYLGWWSTHFGNFHISEYTEFIFYINCVESIYTALAYTHTHTTVYKTLSTQHNCRRKIYLSRWMRRPFNPETKIYGLQTMPHMENNTQYLVWWWAACTHTHTHTHGLVVCCSLWL